MFCTNFCFAASESPANAESNAEQEIVKKEVRPKGRKHAKLEEKNDKSLHTILAGIKKDAEVRTEAIRQGMHNRNEILLHMLLPANDQRKEKFFGNMMKKMDNDNNAKMTMPEDVPDVRTQVNSTTSVEDQSIIESEGVAVHNEEEVDAEQLNADEGEGDIPADLLGLHVENHDVSVEQHVTDDNRNYETV